MGIDLGDYDGDGDDDLYITKFDGETNTLYRNDGGGQFLDATAGSGLGEASFRLTGFGARFASAAGVGGSGCTAMRRYCTGLFVSWHWSANVPAPPSCPPSVAPAAKPCATG